MPQMDVENFTNDYIAALARAANSTPEEIWSRRRGHSLDMVRAIGAAYYRYATNASDQATAKEFGRTAVGPWMDKLEAMNLLNIISWSGFLFRLIQESKGPLISMRDLIRVSTRERLHGNPVLVEDNALADAQG